MRSFRWGAALSVAAIAVACSDSGTSTSPYQLSTVSGDSQTVAVNAASAPLVVKVTGAGDSAQAGVVVHWAIHSGPGTVDAVDTTDAGGLASTVYHSVNVTGKTTVDAQVSGVSQRFTITTHPGAPTRLLVIGGQDQAGPVNAALANPLAVEVADAWGNAVANVWVHWTIALGGGSVSADSTKSDVGGVAKVTRMLGPGGGGQLVLATLPGGADTLVFHATAKKAFTVLAGGNNVAERYTSDLWVAGNYAYTGTWGFRSAYGNVLKVWDVSSGITLVDSIIVPNSQTISDDEVSADGTLLLLTAEYGTGSGLYIYSLVDPAHPVLVDSQVIGGNGLHTGSFADIGGQRYVFAAKDPGAPALMVFRIQTDSADKIVQVASLLQPANYGIHDTYVRDGLAFVSDWNTGLRIYDVGDGRLGGSPSSPQLIGAVVTSSDGLPCNCVHNSWWYHDPFGGKRYVFVGQEGPATIPSAASGDIHVVDVTDMAHPVEVAHYAMSGAGTHNFWMDESRGILYAAYYNGGVVALDVTGTLNGDLASREIARLQPGGGGNTFVWGVMLANGALWVSDMVSGFWKIGVP